MFDPRHHGAGISGGDLKVLAIWTVVGVWLMVRFLRKPHGRAWGELRLASPDSRATGPRALGGSRRRGPAVRDRQGPGHVHLAAFILVPIVDAVTNTGSSSGHCLAIGGAVVFSVVYVVAGR